MWVRKPCDIRPDTFCSSSHWKPCEIVTGITWPVVYKGHGGIINVIEQSVPPAYRGSGKIIRKVLRMQKYVIMVIKSWRAVKSVGALVCLVIGDSWEITWTLTERVPSGRSCTTSVVVEDRKCQQRVRTLPVCLRVSRKSSHHVHILDGIGENIT